MTKKRTEPMTKKRIKPMFKKRIEPMVNIDVRETSRKRFFNLSNRGDF